MAGRAATYRQVFEVREYRYLFGAYTLSLFGDQLTAIAVSFLVYTKTGSATLAAAAFATSYLGWLVGGPTLSGLADRFPRRRVLVVCDVARALLVPVVAVPGLPATAMIGLLFAVSLFRPPFVSARASLMPEVLDGDRYPVANGLDNIVAQASQVLGYGVGGGLVAVLSLPGALLLDAVTFLVSALLVLVGVRSRPAPAGTGSARPGGPAHPGRRSGPSRGGLRVVWTDRRLRGYLLVLWVACAFTFAAEGLVSPLALQYGGGPATAGLLLACAPAGMAAGGVVLTRLCPPEVRPRLILPLAGLSTAVLVTMWTGPPLWLVMCLLATAGMASAFAIPLNAMFGRAAPNAYRGRAFGVAITGLSGFQGLAMVAAGVAADRWSPTTVIGASGLIGTVALLTVVPLWPGTGPDRPATPVPNKVERTRTGVPLPGHRPGTDAEITPIAHGRGTDIHDGAPRR